MSGTSGATLVTDRATDIPAYFAGHWVEIAGKGTWQIASVAAKTITLRPNASEVIAIVAGDTWQGVYRFDTVRSRSAVQLDSDDPIRVVNGVRFEGPPSTEIRIRPELDTPSVVIAGRVAASRIRATSVTIESGATLTHETGRKLHITTQTLNVNGAIDVSGRGYANNQTGEGATTPHAWTGGSHIGAGYGFALGSTFGSITAPFEWGGGGYSSHPGGGVVRVEAQQIAFGAAGVIRANGGTGSERSGAGGSIWLQAAKLTGGGTVEARGGSLVNEAGGGGAIAIGWTDPSTTLPLTFANGGVSDRVLDGGPGSILTKGPAHTFGDLRIANDRGVFRAELPALGSGTALAGTSGATLVTDRATNIPLYFTGHWVEVRTAAGVLRGKWRVGAISAKTVTLLPNGAESIALAAGDTWAGLYRVDRLTLRQTTLHSADTIEHATLDKDAASIFNGGAPRFDDALLSSIVVQGDFVTGPAGAVTDPDQPVKLTATNTRTAQTFLANANANGSFSVPISGANGDTFTLRATDSNAAPLTSRTIAVNGTYVDSVAILSLTVDPSAVTGGTRVYGTLRVTPAARAAITVTLSSSNSAAAAVPAGVTLLAGTSSVQFPIDTTAAAASESVTITATYTNVKTAALTVTPVANALATLTLDAPSVTSGASVNATVTLGAEAPAGGALVLLSSSDTSRARVPDAIVVPAGATSATFTVSTLRIGANADVTITATWGATKNAALSLTACATMPAAAASTTTPSTIWFDDALPSGAAATGSAAFDTTQAASGTQSIHFTASTTARTWSFTGAAPLTVGPNDRLELYALVNPCNPPRQIAVTWSGGTTLKATWGESRIDAGTQKQIGALPAGGAWTRFSVLAKSLGLTTPANLTGLSIAVDGGEAWLDLGGTSACTLPTVPKPSRNAAEVVWFDDDGPAGATLSSANDGNTIPWQWDTAQAAIGTRSHYVAPRSGAHRHELSGATARMSVGHGDVIFTYVLVDPCNPPREILLELNNGTDWNRRAYWGEDLITDGDLSWRANMGPLPAAGEWVRLEVPVSAFEQTNVTSISGIRFSVVDGAAWFDAAGTIPRVNVALNKFAEQPNVYEGQVAAGAVDGNTAAGAHTQYGSQPWWQVDLGAVMPIDTIQLWNRACCGNDVNNVWVFVSDSPFASTTVAGVRAQAGVRAFRYGNAASGRSPELRVQRSGRYVRVQADGSAYMILGEVQVWAPAGATRANLAGGSAGTSHSSFYEGLDAERAVDGRIAGHFGDRSLTHTQSDPNAWWEIDLGSVQPIDRVDLFNRTDCCQERLTNFYVLVSDAPFTNRVLADTLAQSGVSAFHYGTTPRVAYSFDVRRGGRFVRVQLTGTNVMTLSEVQIWSGGTLLKPLARSAPSR